MTSSFDQLRADLATASEQRDQELLTKSLELHAAGALTANQVNLVDMAVRRGVSIPQDLRKAITDAGEQTDKPAKVKMEDIKTPLQHRAGQADTRRRLSLAVEGGAISKTQHHRLCKLLDNGKELPADVAGELAKIRLEKV